ncbi:hypothetical protein GO621_09445 [Mucilaginibacter sp. HMF7410]|uniref:Uncharacterized protein n=1 Tax=Mucilaginibacter arboris TaxID=2682090 RepID=A0A7K1SXL2_9SPHI|nr:hypothetical protein [Mucilaginibacter arboris]MVN21760.1 hypothetical protein [Mucilaginibacter arboris]
MKANHNYCFLLQRPAAVGLNISNSKNESKSQRINGLPSPGNSWVKYQ